MAAFRTFSTLSLVFSVRTLSWSNRVNGEHPPLGSLGLRGRSNDNWQLSTFYRENMQHHATRGVLSQRSPF